MEFILIPQLINSQIKKPHLKVIPIKDNYKFQIKKDFLLSLTGPVTWLGWKVTNHLACLRQK